MKVIYSKRDRDVVAGLLIAYGEKPERSNIDRLLSEVEDEYRKQFISEVKQLIQWYQL